MQRHEQSRRSEMCLVRLKEDAPKSSGNTTTKAKTREDGKVSMFTFGSALAVVSMAVRVQRQGGKFNLANHRSPRLLQISTKQVSFGKPTTASTPSAGGFTFGGGSKNL